MDPRRRGGGGGIVRSPTPPMRLHLIAIDLLREAPLERAVGPARAALQARPSDPQTPRGYSIRAINPRHRENFPPMPPNRSRMIAPDRCRQAPFVRLGRPVMDAEGAHRRAPTGSRPPVADPLSGEGRNSLFTRGGEKVMIGLMRGRITTMLTARAALPSTGVHAGEPAISVSDNVAIVPADGFRGLSLTCRDPAARGWAAIVTPPSPPRREPGRRG